MYRTCPGDLISRGSSSLKIVLSCHQPFTKPHVVRKKSVEVKTPSKKEGKIWPRRPRQITLGKKICQISNLRNLVVLREFKQNFTPFKKSSLQTRRGNKSCLRAVVIYRLATLKLLTALSWEAHKYLAGPIKVQTKDSVAGSEFTLYSSSRVWQD